MTAAAGRARPIAISVPRKAPRHHIRGISSLRGVEPAFRFRMVDPERIELGELVQKSRLRRNRDGYASVAQQDRLAELQVPVAQGQLLSLERRQRETGALEEIESCVRAGRMEMSCR